MTQTKIKPKQLEAITSSNINDLIANNAIPASKLVAGITDVELSFLSGVTAAIQTQINLKLAASALKTSGDSPDWSSDLIAVTAKAVADKIQTEVAAAQIGGSMAFKGKWSTAVINSKVKAGWTYVYDNGTPPTGHVLEPGDMLVAATDSPGTVTTANWIAVQTNINGAVTYIGNAVVNGGIVLFDGVTGTLIKGTALSGLLKLVNGAPAVATAADLPVHAHTVKFKTDESDNSEGGSVQTAEFGDMIEITGGGIIKTNWNSEQKKIIISGDVSISNGVVQAGQYVSGMSVNKGTIELTFATLPSGINKSDWKTQAIPTGTPDGTNRIFTVPESIVAGTEELIINGQVLTRGVDYTISASAITLATDAYIPVSGDIVRVNYVKA